MKWPHNNPNDFIHANWVKHSNLENVFICCQGPTKKTVVDFWRMIWQERVKEIIMLCQVKENNKEKCYQYWPKEVGDKMTVARLTLSAIVVCRKDPDYIQTKIEIQHGKESRRVQHRQWTTWPDRTVPRSSLTPFYLLRHARKHPKYPTVVHCSAGVGRSGTLIMIEILYGALKRGLKPDFKQYLRETEEQYVYAHYVVLQYLWLNRVVCAEDIKGFTNEYLNYVRLLKNTAGVLPFNATSYPASGSTIAKCKPRFTNEYLNYVRLLKSAAGVLPFNATSYPASGSTIAKCKPSPSKKTVDKYEMANSSSEIETRKSSHHHERLSKSERAHESSDRRGAHKHLKRAHEINRLKQENHRVLVTSSGVPPQRFVSQTVDKTVTPKVRPPGQQQLQKSPEKLRLTKMNANQRITKFKQTVQTVQTADEPIVPDEEHIQVLETPEPQLNVVRVPLHAYPRPPVPNIPQPQDSPESCNPAIILPPDAAGFPRQGASKGLLKNGQNHQKIIYTPRLSYTVKPADARGTEYFYKLNAASKYVTATEAKLDQLRQQAKNATAEPKKDTVQEQQN
ncbi:unnamed protein product [Anisakis simplex]|uniref:Uncharacterized protein n=1 Tax=Anisakis simplex TaxID=6269 RepID=A0A3P6R7T1_ANISI|nr:unnamed protein product [Anisakis simplex]